jgi:CRP/FNR family cyclic AMP-dependent transcriptional regulator
VVLALIRIYSFLILRLKKKTIFAQGDSSDAVFNIQSGKVKLIVVSKIGKEATIDILNVGDFFGEGCLTGQALRLSSATAAEEREPVASHWN